MEKTGMAKKTPLVLPNRRACHVRCLRRRRPTFPVSGVDWIFKPAVPGVGYTYPRGVSLRESSSLAGSAPPGAPCVDTAPPGAWFLKAAAAISLFWPTPVSPSMASRSSSCASATDRSVPTGSPPKPTSGGLTIIATYRGRTALGKEVFPSEGVQTRHAPFLQATRSATS
jgi:hypothetical protein